LYSAQGDDLSHFFELYIEKCPQALRNFKVFRDLLQRHLCISNMHLRRVKYVALLFIVAAPHMLPKVTKDTPECQAMMVELGVKLYYEMLPSSFNKVACMRSSVIVHPLYTSDFAALEKYIITATKSCI